MKTNYHIASLVFYVIAVLSFVLFVVSNAAAGLDSLREVSYMTGVLNLALGVVFMFAAMKAGKKKDQESTD